MRRKERSKYASYYQKYHWAQMELVAVMMGQHPLPQHNSESALHLELLQM